MIDSLLAVLPFNQDWTGEIFTLFVYIYAKCSEKFGINETDSLLFAYLFNLLIFLSLNITHVHLRLYYSTE